MNGLVVNRIILGLVRELLELPDLHSIVPRMDPLDIELLLDFILYVRMHLPRSLVLDCHLLLTATPK